MSLNLDDIARLAGVSRATASRVINNHLDVSAVTRQKVQKIIDKYHFKPNLAARMLVTQKTSIIGIIIGDPTRAFRSYHTSILFQGINDITYERDHATLTWWQHITTEKDHFSERILQQKRLMDGMLITSTEIENALTDPRWAASARHDGAGAGCQPGTPDRREADQYARRLTTGHGAECTHGPTRISQYEHSVHHARSRPGTLRE
ncbi:MAG: LacI family DNA-binding transcriptional regulator [Anaerolineae bacterium]|nr:LacI family DNA-binding transcriptional regulator [Anaerolineae bacterium]